MFIDSGLLDSLIQPVLAGHLSVTIHDFKLHAQGGEIPLDAQLRLREDSEGFELELRDSEGTDLSGFFSHKNTYTPADTLRGTGSVGNALQIECEGIWPPYSSTLRLVGDVTASTASFDLDEIRIATGAPGLVADISSHRPCRFDHLAIFANTTLKFTNGSTQLAETHSFWGERIASKDATWDGEALNGVFSLRQVGAHLEVGSWICSNSSSGSAMGRHMEITGA